MNRIVREERAGDVLGVPGRFFGVVASADGLILNQRWISNARPSVENGAPVVLRATIRFDDECRNGREAFSITGEARDPGLRGDRGFVSGGCVHDDIAATFPELAPLIRWHLCATDGPMHYVGNTIYHARENGPTHAWVYFKGPAATDPLGLGNDGERERLLGYLKADRARAADGQPGYRVVWDEKTVKVRNLAHARSSACWPDATHGQLCAAPDVLRAALLARLPALLAEFRADVERAGFVWPAERGAA